VRERERKKKKKKNKKRKDVVDVMQSPAKYACPAPVLSCPVLSCPVPPRLQNATLKKSD